MKKQLHNELHERNVLIVSSTYSTFIKRILDILVKYFNFSVIKPYSDGLKFADYEDNIRIFRFKQTPFRKICISNQSFRKRTGFVEGLRRKPYKAIFIPYLIFQQVKEIKRIVKREKIYLINAHWIYPSGLSCVLYKLFFNNKIKMILTIHGPDFWIFDNIFMNRLKKYIISKYNIITVTDFQIKSKLEKWNIKKNIYRIPMGIDTSLFNDNNTKLRFTDDKPIEIMTLGRISTKVKGFVYLATSLKKLESYNIDFHLTVVGHYNKDNIDLVKNMRILSYIDFEGVVPNEKVPEYLKKTDIFVLPSLSEGWPVSVMEALSSKCICVVSDLPCYTEFNEEHKFIVKFKKASADDLTEKLLYVISNFGELTKYRAAAREYSKTNFDINNISQRFENIYYQLLNEDN